MRKILYSDFENWQWLMVCIAYTLCALFFIHRNILYCAVWYLFVGLGTKYEIILLTCGKFKLFCCGNNDCYRCPNRKYTADCFSSPFISINRMRVRTRMYWFFTEIWARYIHNCFARWFGYSIFLYSVFSLSLSLSPIHSVILFFFFT